MTQNLYSIARNVVLGLSIAGFTYGLSDNAYAGRYWPKSCPNPVEVLTNKIEEIADKADSTLPPTSDPFTKEQRKEHRRKATEKLKDRVNRFPFN